MAHCTHACAAQTQCYDLEWAVYGSWCCMCGLFFMLFVPWMFYSLVSHQRHRNVGAYMKLVFAEAMRQRQVGTASSAAVLWCGGRATAP